MIHEESAARARRVVRIGKGPLKAEELANLTTHEAGGSRVRYVVLSLETDAEARRRYSVTERAIQGVKFPGGETYLEVVEDDERPTEIAIRVVMDERAQGEIWFMRSAVQMLGRALQQVPVVPAEENS